MSNIKQDYDITELCALSQGNSYWKFHNLQMIYGPKNISEGFDGIPSDLDTAFVWSGNGKT